MGVDLRIVLFDLDHTLISGDSDFEWAQFLIGQGVLDREVYEARNQEFYDAYMAGTLDIYAFLDFQLKPLSRHGLAQLEDWHALFMSQKILPMITSRAREEVAQAKETADYVVMITATNCFVTGPIAREFGISHLIATIPEKKNGNYTGQVDGVPCFREGKITRFHQWLENQGLSWESVNECRFYSDSHNDLPLLKMVSEPVAVDPDTILSEYARRCQWPVISLR